MWPVSTQAPNPVERPSTALSTVSTPLNRCVGPWLWMPILIPYSPISLSTYSPASGSGSAEIIPDPIAFAKSKIFRASASPSFLKPMTP